MGKKKDKLDVFHYHEAMDRASMMCDILEDSFLCHPVLEKHSKIRRKALRAQELLASVYQELALKKFEKHENREEREI